MSTPKRHVVLGGKPYPINTAKQITELAKAWEAAGAQIGSRLRIRLSDGTAEGKPIVSDNPDDCWMTF